MPFDINRKLFVRSYSVKCIDYHPRRPWLITGVHDGTVNIYNLESGAIILTHKIAEVSVCCVKFIAQKNWCVAGSNDGKLHVLNYDTYGKVVTFQAHPDAVRCLTVHPAAPIILTGSDDTTIKAWDWDRLWYNVQTYQGHASSIMNIAFNPTFNPANSGSFTSASFDGTVKMWSITSPVASFTMQTDIQGVRSVEFHPNADKPYLVTAGDAHTIKVWDYPSQSCVEVLRGHYRNVSFAVFHPDLPIIISGSEDQTIKVWNSDTYAIEQTLNYELGCAWCIAIRKGTNEVAVGFDNGVVTLELGRSEPRFSMDRAGKLIYTHNYEVLTTNLGTRDRIIDNAFSDGAQIPLRTMDLGSTYIFASSLLHSPNGRFITFVGGGRYYIYYVLVWFPVSFGIGTSFAWAPDSNTYAVLESKTKLKIFKNFEEKTGGVFVGMKNSGKLVMEALYTGPILGARGPGYVIFWDWETGEIVRRIDIDAENIYWSSTGTHGALTSFDTFYIFHFDRNVFQDKLEKHGPPLANVGIPESFTLLSVLPDAIQTAKWFGDCLMYTTSTQLCYLIGSTQHPHLETTQEGQESEQEWVSHTISSQLDHKLYLLGYLPAHEKVYVMDKNMKVYGFGLSLAVVEFQKALQSGNMDNVRDLLKNMPKKQLNKVAKYFEGRGMKEFTVAVATAPEHELEFSQSLDNLTAAYNALSLSLPSTATFQPPFDQTDDATTDRPTQILCIDQAQRETGISIDGSGTRHRHNEELYQRCTSLVMEFMATKPKSKFISELRHDKAQDMAELLSKMVHDETNFTQRERKHILHLLSKLTRSAEVFPQSLELEGVQCNLTNIIIAGGYGFIYKGEYDGNPVCVKAVHIDSRGIDRTKLKAHASELILWAHLFHPNVLPFLGICLSMEEVPRVCIISPWMNNGDLLQYLNKIPGAPRKPLVRDIISGLQYLHNLDIVHADLKAKNVLVSESGRAMLADFGISRLSMTQTTTTTNASVGTVYWSAPELVLEEKPPSRQSDIWAFACTCYEVITGMTPFKQYHIAPQLIFAFMKGTVIPLKPTPGIGWDEDVWSLAMRCWQADPASRPGTQELLEAINSCNFLDNRSSDRDKPEKRTSHTEIDYHHILRIFDEIHQSALV